MTEVSVHYFAVLREQAGRTSETVRTEAGTLGELFEELRTRHGFSLGRAALKVAVNDDFADWNARVQPGDRVVFIPPVAGG